MNTFNSTEHILIAQIQLLLDEKRAAMSIMRTGIFILITQLFIIAIMIATSQFYEMLHILHMAIPFYIINVALFFLGCYFIIYAFSRIRKYDTIISKLKKKDWRIDEILS